MEEKKKGEVRVKEQMMELKRLRRLVVVLLTLDGTAPAVHGICHYMPSLTSQVMIIIITEDKPIPADDSVTCIHSQ